MANRTKEIKIRLTEQEHQILLSKMSGSQLASWIRKTCLNCEQDTKHRYTPIDPLLLRELGKIGGNLNQIAKHANTDALGGKIDQIRLLAELATIREQLNVLLMMAQE